MTRSTRIAGSLICALCVVCGQSSAASPDDYVPRHDMVVVVTGDDTYRGYVGPLEFLYGDILRAIEEEP